MKTEVSKKYELVGLTLGKHSFADYGVIDFATLTLAEADQLYKNKFPYLVKKKKEEQKTV